MDDSTPPLLLARDVAAVAARNDLDRAYRSGLYHRVTTGVYVDARVWRGLDPQERHLLLAHASHLLRRRRIVFSHWTAAVAWGLPIVGELPSETHAVAAHAGGGRTDEHLVRHCTGIPERTEQRRGLEVTSLAKTVVDLSRVAPFATAVAAADAALRDHPWLTPELLAAEIGPAGRRGSARAQRVVAFADRRSGSPGESVSRASMALAGLPSPELQMRFDDRRGSIFVDFWWPRFGLVGEFDGRVKYEDPAFLAGRTPEQALLDEKDREDRIRALGPRVTRWRWDVATSPARLRAHLMAAGVRLERYRDW